MDFVPLLTVMLCMVAVTMLLRNLWPRLNHTGLGAAPTVIQYQIGFDEQKETVVAECRSDSSFQTPTGNGRVLVVDDEPDIRRIVRMTLEKAGYEVLEAEDGQGAIEIINSGENRLMLEAVLCDIRMPNINGIEAMAYFRENFPRVQLVVLTGFPDTETAVSCMHNGVVDYLIKPVDDGRLKAAVALAMQRRERAWR